jgi:DNA-binding protein HU-beta
LVPDVPRKFPLPAPLNKLKDSAFDAVKDPRGTSERLIGQARGAASAGRHLAGGLASQVAEQVNTRRRRASDAPRAESRVDTHAAPSPAPRKAQGDPVAPHPATDAPSAEPVPATEARVAATKATPADVAKKTAKKASTKKTPAKKTAAKKTTAKKAPAKKTAKKAPGDKLPPRAATAPTPPPPPAEVEPNPEATPPR